MRRVSLSRGGYPYHFADGVYSGARPPLLFLAEGSLVRDDLLGVEAEGVHQVRVTLRLVVGSLEVGAAILLLLVLSRAFSSCRQRLNLRPFSNFDSRSAPEALELVHRGLLLGSADPSLRFPMGGKTPSLIRRARSSHCPPSCGSQLPPSSLSRWLPPPVLLV